MTDEQKEEQQKTSKRPSFGGLGQQYAAVGGTKRSRRQDAQAPNAPDEQKEEPLEDQTPSGSDAQTVEQPTTQQSSSLDTQVVKQQDSQESKMSEVQTYKSVDAQASSSSDATKAEKLERKKRTIYLEPDLDRWIRHRIADTEEEISEVINIAIRHFMSSRNE